MATIYKVCHGGEAYGSRHQAAIRPGGCPPHRRGAIMHSPRGRRPMRRLFAMTLALSLTAGANGAEPPWSAQEYQADSTDLCSQIGSPYAYFDSKPQPWDPVCDLYRP